MAGKLFVSEHLKVAPLSLPPHLSSLRASFCTEKTRRSNLTFLIHSVRAHCLLLEVIEELKFMTISGRMINIMWAKEQLLIVTVITQKSTNLVVLEVQSILHEDLNLISQIQSLTETLTKWGLDLHRSVLSEMNYSLVLLRKCTITSWWIMVLCHLLCNIIGLFFTVTFYMLDKSVLR